ncbi:winged helix DNA-binding domain-containing protein [Dactylosporangium sp. CS-047395]|uniref:winged helix DNA-binding domain-containing protein n=1 Tax=Dactylosporangium sp. CS-047395 TaxID=3239936 RepID=UPI003D8F2001
MRISLRALNRTYLRRQLLLGGGPRDVEAVVRHLVAVQAQEVDAPYVSMWLRLPEFAHDGLSAALRDRVVVRGGLLRGTQHITAGTDYLWLRPLLAGRRGNAGLSPFRQQIEGLELAEIVRAAREIMAGRTLTRPQLAKALGERFPGRQGIPLAWAAQHQLAIIHPPPTGTWRRRGHVHCALAEEWIGAPLRADGDVRELFRRYLVGCGPATIQDFQVWSGLRKMREEIEGMRGELRVYVDDSGRELFDLPELGIADGDEPVPVRFVPEFDNLVLSHEDRARIIVNAADRAEITPGYSVVKPTFLEDGFVAGTWAVEGGRLDITPFRPLRDAAAVYEQAVQLADFLQLEQGQGTDRIRLG